jgi:hypothetical protein
VKKSRKNATVDLRVQSRRMKVKMNQPYHSESDLDFVRREKKDETHHEVEAEGVYKPNGTVCLFDRGDNIKSTRS